MLQNFVGQDINEVPPEGSWEEEITLASYIELTTVTAAIDEGILDSHKTISVKGKTLDSNTKDMSLNSQKASVSESAKPEMKFVEMSKEPRIVYAPGT